MSEPLSAPKIEIVPELSTPTKVGYRFVFTTTVTNNNWIRIRQGNASDADWKTFSCHEYDYGGFDFPEPVQRFETRELTELDRLKLREELPF